MKIVRCGMLALAVAAASSRAGAVTMVLEAQRDASIFENNPDNGSGAGNGLFAGTNGTRSPRRALLSFDVTALPQGATIQAVDLTLHLGQVAGSGGGGGGGIASAAIDLRRVAAPWGEGSSQQQTPRSDTFAQMGQGVEAVEGDVTWASRFFSSSTPTLWNTPGGDFASTASSTLTVGTTLNVPYAWPSTPAMVADVQSWLAAPNSNHGWMLVNQDETAATTFRAFYSRDVATELYQPKLTVTFTAPSVQTADFDGDSDVDGADFLAWQRGAGVLTGATRELGDANGDGAVNALDLAVWRQQWSSPAPAIALPEAPALPLAVIASCASTLGLRSAKRRLL